MKACFDRIRSNCVPLLSTILEHVMSPRINRFAFVRSFAVAAAVLAAIATQFAAANVYTWDNGLRQRRSYRRQRDVESLRANWWNGSGYLFWPNGTDTAQLASPAATPMPTP